MNQRYGVMAGVVVGISALGCSGSGSGGGDDSGGAGAGAGNGAPSDTLLYDRGERFPGGLVVVGDMVYWREAGRLLSAPKDGSGPVADMFGPNVTGTIFPGDGELFARGKVEGSSVEQLMRFPLDGGDVEPVPFYYQDEPLRSYNDSSYRDGAFFVALSGCQAILQVDLSTGEAQALWDSGERDPSTVGATMAMDDENVYCATRKQIQRVPREGGTPTPVSAVGWGSFAPLVSDGRYLYFGKGLGDELGRLPVDADGDVDVEQLSDNSACDYLALSPDNRWLLEVYQGAAGAITVAPIAGDEFGPLRLLASKLNSPNSVAADETHAYWAQNYGVHRARL